MNIFKSYTYKWWQIGVLKLSLLCIGAAIGAYFAPYVLSNMRVIILIGIVAALYSIVVALKQN